MTFLQSMLAMGSLVSGASLEYGALGDTAVVHEMVEFGWCGDFQRYSRNTEPGAGLTYHVAW